LSRCTCLTEMPVPKKRALISIVDDDDDVREAIRGLMRALRFATEAFSSADEFLRSSKIDLTACLIADINMPGMSGLDLHRRLLKLGKSIPTILITAYPTEDTRMLALESGVIKYLTKPFVEAELVDGVHMALAQSRRGG
jgi:FixJ family two-component response regulator